MRGWVDCACVLPVQDNVKVQGGLERVPGVARYVKDNLNGDNFKVKGGIERVPGVARYVKDNLNGDNFKVKGGLERVPGVETHQG